MAKTTVPLNVPAEQPTRRAMLGALAAGVLGSAAAPVVATGAPDPHPAWEREALALQVRINAEPGMEQDRFDDLHEQWNALQELIAETPAVTMAGLAAQLRLVKSGLEEDSAVANYAWETAVETALTTIEGLAGGRV